MIITLINLTWFTESLTTVITPPRPYLKYFGNAQNSCVILPKNLAPKIYVNTHYRSRYTYIKHDCAVLNRSRAYRTNQRGSRKERIYILYPGWRRQNNFANDCRYRFDSSANVRARLLLHSRRATSRSCTHTYIYIARRRYTFRSFFR